MTSCRFFQPRLALWAGGDLPAHETAALQSHLAICPTCGERLQQLQQAVTTLSHSDPEPTFVEQPRSLWPEVNRQITAAASIPKVPIYQMKWVWRMAAACFLVLATWLSWPRGPIQPGNPDSRGAAHPGMLEVPSEEEVETAPYESHSRGLRSHDQQSPTWLTPDF